MTTSIPPEVDLGALPALPRDDAGPVFSAPWEAQAFAMTLSLHARGVFTWREWADVLLGRGVADPRQIYPQRYLGGVFGGFPPDWQPRDRFVVTAYHPIVVRSARIPAAYIERLRAAGARPVAAFEGFREPLDGTVYDPIDADYVPLTGFGRLERPGPNITIWELPSAVARRPGLESHRAAGENGGLERSR